MLGAGRASGGAVVDPEALPSPTGDPEALRGAGLRRMMAAEEPQQKPEPLGGDADGTDGPRAEPPPPHASSCVPGDPPGTPGPGPPSALRGTRR